MKRRYSNVRILTEVYVTSHADYWFKVVMDGGPTRNYCPSHGFDGRGYHFEWTAPQYLVAEVSLQIAQGCREGWFKFYEYDRDGNKRYENLRYHEQEHVDWMGEHLGGEKA